MMLNGDGVKVVRKKWEPRKPVKMHPALAAALAKNKKALATFEASSTSNKREYMEWIAEAKGDDTRAPCEDGDRMDGRGQDVQLEVPTVLTGARGAAGSHARSRSSGAGSVLAEREAARIAPDEQRVTTGRHDPGALGRLLGFHSGDRRPRLRRGARLDAEQYRRRRRAAEPAPRDRGPELFRDQGARLRRAGRVRRRPST